MTSNQGRRELGWSNVSQQVKNTIAAGLPDLFEAIRIPSVNAWGPENMSRSGRFLRDLLMNDKWTAEIVNVPGNVIVFAERGPEGKVGVPTILLYGHHDVQPPEPIDAWTSPPFEPVIRDGRLWGRGASDDKGEFFCHLFAVRALSEVLGDLPVRVKLFLDGGEENGSPGISEAIETLRPKLKANFMYTADGPAHISGRPRISFGFRGILRLSLTVRTADRNLHSGAWGNLAPQATLRLAQILAGIKGRDGHVEVPGFYDGVRGPSAPERRALADIPFDSHDTAASIGAASLEGPNDVPAMERLQFMPTFTVTGMSSGYTGPGFQSMIPAEAIARIEVRFVPDQDPERIYAALNVHLARTAPEARLEMTGSMPTSRTPLDTPATTSVVAALKRGYGVEPLLYPCSGGSSPEALFTKGLGLPSLWGHCANYDQQNHAPDENMTLDAINKCTLSTAALLVDMARVPLAQTDD